MKQEKVWDKIAYEWYEFKTKPAEHTLKFLKTKTGNVLDLGSGAGRHLIKNKNQKMYLVDFSKEMIKLAKKRAKEKNINAEFNISNLTNLPFLNNFFDSAICIASLHCIKGKINRTKAIKELFRVLKPKAEAEIAVWNKNSNKFKNSPKEKYVKWRDKGARYYYLFEEKEIHELFKKVGFKIKKTYAPKRNIIFIVEKSISS
jgi:ubiquinone/menaquinone biosynthesis C-methylase UbiE